jgi:hypothetical protein
MKGKKVGDYTKRQKYAEYIKELVYLCPGGTVSAYYPVLKEETGNSSMRYWYEVFEYCVDQGYIHIELGTSTVRYYV